MTKFDKNDNIVSFQKRFPKKNGKTQRKEREYIIHGESVPLWYVTDKNCQIYDCSRIGRSLDRLHGRPEAAVDPFEVMLDEYHRQHGELSVSMSL